VGRLLGADLVIYQDLPDLETAALAGNPKLSTMCNACFTGNYPTGDVTPAMLEAIEHERLTNGGAGRGQGGAPVRWPAREPNGAFSR
jgi:amidophosphoribosyltransferase